MQRQAGRRNRRAPLRQAATAKRRSSVSPACLALRAPESTQKLQPLIWLARRWTSSSVADGTPPFLVALSRACMAFVASGRIVAGLLIRVCMIHLLQVSVLHQDALTSRQRPHQFLDF